MGYALGLTGGSMMLALLLYPLRKHVSALRALGPLKYWFRLHMLLGILGPVLILFHCSFGVGSINATVALACMLLVATSGIVGRFVYGRIHHGLYGSRATLRELQAELESRRQEIAPILAEVPAMRDAFDDFLARAPQEPRGRWARLNHFVGLGRQRRRAERAMRRALRLSEPDASGDDLRAIVGAMDETLRAVQRAAQFSTYEMLFSLWHVVHVPFIYLFVITAAVHVLAVHMY
ncbi:MAG: hypothetical protein H6982_15175 [Chromatiales bacterium]|nr:hypothetical protein [Chromatiales bacterium]